MSADRDSVATTRAALVEAQALLARPSWFCTCLPQLARAGVTDPDCPGHLIGGCRATNLVKARLALESVGLPSRAPARELAPLVTVMVRELDAVAQECWAPTFEALGPAPALAVA